jgi:hypothetical protein
MNNAVRNPEAGARAAHYMGAEYAANPGSSRMEYLDSAAWYFGSDKESRSDLTPEEKTILHREFQKGIEAERATQ